MNRVVNFLQKYFAVISVLIGISILLSISFSSFIVTSNNHKAAEMYIGELKYSMEIDETTTNTLTVPTGETIIDVKVNNLNPVDTYYKLLYLKNTNITVKYFETTKDTSDVVTTYNKPNDSVASSNSNTIKLLITNNSTSSQNIALTMKGGYITNTIQDITTPSTYSEITLVETPSTNTYFCKTNDTLTQGLKYINGQYTYAYKQEGAPASSGLGWSNITNNGWGVQLTDKASTDAVTSKLCTYINDKPVTSMSYVFWDSQATTINASDFDTSNVANMNSMFARSSATSIDVSNFNTSSVINMQCMLCDSQATTIDVSNFNTSNVTNMNSMFWNSKATTIDVSNFDTSNVTNMNGMFSDSQASTLDVSGFNTSNVTNMTNMFNGSQATTLDVSNFDTSKVTNMSNMFYANTNLKTIYASNKFVTTAVTDSSNMFTGSTNLVGGAGTTYNSSYTDKTYARIDKSGTPGYFTDAANKPSTFPTDDWATIVASVKAGNTRGYKVGETKEIDMGTYGTHTIRVANTSTPSECSTDGFSQTACGFVLEFADIITTHYMSSTKTNDGGWPATSMRTFVNNDIYNALPSDLRNVIIDTIVVSEYSYKSTDKLYLLASKEIYTNWSYTADTSSNVSRTLDYYKNIGTTTYNSNGVIKKNGSTANYWWLRTVYPHDNYSFFYVYSGKDDDKDYTANYYLGVSPAFRIG